MNKACVAKQCPLISKLPALKKTGDADADQTAILERNAFVRVVANLWCRPRLALLTDSWLQAKIEAEDSKADFQPEYCFAVAPAAIGQIEHTWVCGYIKEKLGLTDADLGKVKAHDSQAPYLLLAQYLNSTLGLRLTPECVDKRVLKKVLDTRHAMVSSRLQACTEGTWIADSGQIDWGKVGSFGLQFQNDKLIRVLHRGSGVWTDVDADMGIDMKWDLDNNWCDTRARLIKDKARRYLVMDLFTKQSGARALPTWTGGEKAFESLCEDASRQISELDANTKSSGEVTELGDNFQTPLKQKQQAAAARARQQLEASNESTQKKRRLSVATASVPVAKAAAQTDKKPEIAAARGK